MAAHVDRPGRRRHGRGEVVTPLVKKHRLIEWSFLVALLAACAVLTVLQRRWTQNLGQAATRQQDTSLREQAGGFCHAFDTGLADALARLRPDGESLRSLGREEAHAACLRRWQAAGGRPMFRRLAVAVPEEGRLALYLLDPSTARLAATAWPPEWTTLREKLAGRAFGRPGDFFEDPAGLLREYPIFGGDDGGPGRPGRPGESEWMIFELDPVYLRQTWLPELARAYLDPIKGMVARAAVRTRASPPETLFTVGGDAPPTDGEPVLLDFNRQSRGGPPRGGPPDGEGPDTGPGHDGSWTLSVWPRTDELAAAVSDARTHDFTLACVLDAGLLIGGLLIIHYARRARRLGDARMQFVAAVSHELRTPLTVLRAAGQNLRRGIVREPEHIDKYANVIVEHSDQLADMVEQVLAFAGARRNESTLARKPVAVAQVVQEAVAACSADTRAAGCEVQTVIEGSPPPVLGDANALRRVFQNLLTNAAKHGGGGRWIGVQVRCVNGSAPGRVEVSVSDRGEGVPAREQAHVFEPFFRGARARGQQIRGSGIGLSVVQEIVKVHGGSVRVESGAERGAVFTVSLPAADVSQVS